MLCAILFPPLILNVALKIIYFLPLQSWVTRNRGVTIGRLPSTIPGEKKTSIRYMVQKPLFSSWV